MNVKPSIGQLRMCDADVAAEQETSFSPEFLSGFFFFVRRATVIFMFYFSVIAICSFLAKQK